MEADAGAFEVFLDGEQIFSKHESGRFPEPEEILAAIDRRISGG